MKTSIHASLFIVLFLLANGCNNRREELQQQYTALQNSNAQLNQDLIARDEFVNKMADSINTIYTNMDEIKMRESSLLEEKNQMESSAKLSGVEIRTRLAERIGNIGKMLADDHNRIRSLQNDLAASRIHFASLKTLVANLIMTYTEREHSISELKDRIDGLQHDLNEEDKLISEKASLISAKDSVIHVQENEITKAYYISGTTDELEQMGLIEKEGGFPWGWIGATHTLASGFDKNYFRTIDNTIKNTIQVNGEIEEIIPKRYEQTYRQEKSADEHSTLTISDPRNFWKEKYLIIVTDRPGKPELLGLMRRDMKYGHRTFTNPRSDLQE